MAGDLKTHFHDAVLTSVDPGGDGIPSRGGDPHANVGGDSALKTLWNDPVVSTPGGTESANSQSGLPALPSRMAPSPEAPPMPPSLKDRSPGTIDQK
jgi:hypothetical protein